MPAVRATRRGNPAWVLFFLILAVVVVAAVAALLAYLAIGGVVTVPFTDPPRVISFTQKDAPEEWKPAPGMVAIPLSARTIRAYSAVTRDDLLVPKSLQWNVTWVAPENLPAEVIRNQADIIERVMKHEKPGGYAFTEADFLPKGTRPGLVAGIPPGMRAMRVELDKVRGLFGLAPGDRFDLVATQEIDDGGAAGLQRLGGVYGEKMAIESSLQAPGRKAAVRVIVQNGSVVSPAQVVEIPVGTSSLTRGRGVSTRPVQEVVIAVRPEEVGPLAEALAVESELSVVPRSGRPEDPMDSITPDLVPKRPFDDASADASGSTGVKLVETIGGSTRDIVPVPRTGSAKEPK